MDAIATPHDTFFRESFGRREIAVDFLRSQLPPALLTEIDLGTLAIAKDSYVSADLRAAYSDFTYALHDLSARSNAEIKGDVLTRVVQLALRWIFSDQPIERLRELIALIEQVQDRSTAVAVLESLLRYYVQGTQRVGEDDVRLLLQQTATGEPIMQTFIDRYIEQGREQGRQEGWQEGRQEGRQEGEAAVLLRQIERKFGAPSQAVRERIASADADTLLQWSERILSVDSVEALLH